MFLCPVNLTKAALAPTMADPVTQENSNHSSVFTAAKQTTSKRNVSPGSKTMLPVLITKEKQQANESGNESEGELNLVFLFQA